MCVVDYDKATVYDTHTVKRARKEHRCAECNRIIAIGESYDYTFGVWNGRPSVFKTCVGCTLAAHWLTRNCNGFLHGDIYDELRAHFDGEERDIWTVGIDRGDVTPVIYYPSKSRLWIGRVLVGMRKQWVGIDIAKLAS